MSESVALETSMTKTLAIIPFQYAIILNAASIGLVQWASAQFDNLKCYG